MSPDDLAAALSQGDVAPAYLLAGEEALLRDDALRAIRAQVLDGAADDFNFQRLPGDATTPGALAEALAALPVLAARRLVVLIEPESRRGGSKALLDALADALPAHLQQRESVLVVAASRPDKRSRWVKAMGKAPAVVVACDAPKGARGVASFVRAEAKRQGVAFENAASERLAELVGPQLLLLRQEIAKASLLAGPGEKVSRAHVEQATQSLPEQPIWDLTDAIGDGASAQALVLLSRMGDVAAPVLLGALAAHFRKLSRVRSGGSVGGPPFVRRKLEGQAGRFTPGRLHACMQAIHETDVAIKGASALPPRLAIERLVLALSS
jgi:DNA polymerase-3 subunit delta